jgi:hypothetical protein
VPRKRHNRPKIPQKHTVHRAIVLAVLMVLALALLWLMLFASR